MSALYERLLIGLKEIEAFMDGKDEGFRVHIPDEINVQLIRKRLDMTQQAFADTFGFSLDAVKHWESGRRVPEAAARAFLIVIHNDPVAVLMALKGSDHRAIAKSTPSPRKRRTLASAAPASRKTSSRKV